MFVLFHIHCPLWVNPSPLRVTSAIAPAPSPAAKPGTQDLKEVLKHPHEKKTNDD